MRQPVSSAAKNRVFPQTISAPTAGWNTVDPISTMREDYALILDNFWPTSSAVELRKGWTNFASLPTDSPPGSAHDIKALLSYTSVDATKKLFACDNTGIYDVTAGGAVAVPALVRTSGEVNSVLTATAAGTFLWTCNGTDDSAYFNGAAWVVLNALSVPPMTGVTSADVINVSLFKTRLILTVKDSLSFFYLPVDSVAGVASEFPLGTLFPKGGYLVATASWSMDAGDGMDDRFVAITSEGELAVYAGTNPASATDWSLQGVYYVGKPIGSKCFIKAGGDLGIITEGGLFPMSRAMATAATSNKEAISRKIENVFTDYASSYASYYGWQAISFPSASMLLVNVPIVFSSDLNVSYSVQLVMNTITKAWARFTGMDSQAWVTHDGKLYFANHDKVNEAWTGKNDNGSIIDGKLKTAFNYLTPAGREKHIQLAKPVITCSGTNIKAQIGFDVDFRSKELSSTISGSSSSAAIWDSGLWNQVRWSDADLTISDWRTVASYPGRCFAFRLRLLVKDVTFVLNAVEVLAAPGGLL